jgi:two-component system phosphate regulon response regulator OmpR
MLLLYWYGKRHNSAAMPLSANENPENLPHVLVVDDDGRIRALVSRFLNENGFLAVTAKDAAEAREILKRFEFDALVVDIMMPGESGLEFTKSLRAQEDIPVLLLTALGESQDRIAGLESGADDYLPKPFEPRELVLRLQAILRRRPRKVEAVKSFMVGRWTYNPDLNALEAGEVAQRLTTVEGNLLRALASRAGLIVSRDELARLCDMDVAGERTIDVQVTRLRRKLEEDTRQPRFLQTVRGKGYVLRVREEGT